MVERREQPVAYNLVSGILFPEGRLNVVKDVAAHCRGVNLDRIIAAGNDYIEIVYDPLTGVPEEKQDTVQEGSVYVLFSSSSGTLYRFWEKYLKE